RQALGLDTKLTRLPPCAQDFAFQRHDDDTVIPRISDIQVPVRPDRDAVRALEYALVRLRIRTAVNRHGLRVEMDRGDAIVEHVSDIKLVFTYSDIQRL